MFIKQHWNDYFDLERERGIMKKKQDREKKISFMIKKVNFVLGNFSVLVK